MRSALISRCAPLNDPHINLEFDNEDGSVFTLFLMRVDRTDLTTEQRVEAFSEIIRHFMEDGAERLPTLDQSHEFKDDAMKEIWEMYKLFPLWEKNVSFLTKMLGILPMLPISAIGSAISYPTEILYYHLEKHIKTNLFPTRNESSLPLRRSRQGLVPETGHQRSCLIESMRVQCR
jgi:hypothetical protein